MSSYICPTHGVGPICQDCVNGIGRADGWTPAFGRNNALAGADRSSAAQANAAASWAGMAADHQPRVGRRDWEVPAAPQQPLMPYAPDTEGKAARQAAYSAAMLAGLYYWESTLRDQYRAAHPSAPAAEVNRYAARWTNFFMLSVLSGVLIGFAILFFVLLPLLEA